MALTEKAEPGSFSQASVRWNAAALITTSGVWRAMDASTARTSVTSTSEWGGRTSWCPASAATAARSNPNCPRPPNTRSRMGALPGGAGAFGVEPRDLLAGLPLRRRRHRPGQGVAVAADDVHLLLQEL